MTRKRILWQVEGLGWLDLDLCWCPWSGIPGASFLIRTVGCSADSDFWCQ